MEGGRKKVFDPDGFPGQVRRILDDNLQKDGALCSASVSPDT